jgi:putative transposase
MEFLRNTLLEWQTADEKPDVDCVVSVEPNGEKVRLIWINDDRAWIRSVSRAELETGLAKGEIRIVQTNPSARLNPPDEEIPTKHKEIRDRRYDIIRPLIELPGDDLFDPEIRGRVINEICAKHKLSKKTPFNLLRLYWQRGQMKNSLLPDFLECGGRNKEHRCSDRKRGRPNETRERLGLSPGVNIGPEEKKKLQRGVELFYRKGKLNAVDAHQRTLERFFCKEYDEEGKPILPPPDEAPSIHQFRHCINQLEDPTKTLIAREGATKFNLKCGANLIMRPICWQIG